MSEPSAWECEHDHLLDHTDENLRLMPPAIRQRVGQHGQGMCPFAFGRHPALGWFALESGGQGPYFVWREWVDG